MRRRRLSTRNDGRVPQDAVGVDPNRSNHHHHVLASLHEEIGNDEDDYDETGGVVIASTPFQDRVTTPNVAAWIAQDGSILSARLRAIIKECSSSDEGRHGDNNDKKIISKIQSRFENARHAHKVDALNHSDIRGRRPSEIKYDEASLPRLRRLNDLLPQAIKLNKDFQVSAS